MKTGRIIWGVLIVLLLAGLGYFIYRDYLAPVPAAQAQGTSTPEAPPADTSPATTISSEGRVEALQSVDLGFPSPGRVQEVLVQEGQAVKAGDALVKLDTRAQEAALGQANAAVQSAQAALESARTRLEQVRAAANTQEASTRASSWGTDLPTEVDQPSWYFTTTEEISATRTEVETSRQELGIKQEDLQRVQSQASSADITAAEKRLSEAQTAFLVADQVLKRGQDSGNADLKDQAQTAYDAALSELNAAQDTYKAALDTDGAKQVTSARAAVAVAQERYDTAVERLNSLLTGEESFDVRLARQDVDRAQAALQEATAAQESAQTAIDQMTLSAPFDGTITRVDVSPGQTAAPGIAAVTLGDFSQWVVKTTDLSETDVATLEPGMSANVSLDAFPGQTFTGTVRSIALWSDDNRGSVTYEVVVVFDAGSAPVRSGMTAFVEIQP